MSTAASSIAEKQATEGAGSVIEPQPVVSGQGADNKVDERRKAPAASLSSHPFAHAAISCLRRTAELSDVKQARIDTLGAQRQAALLAKLLGLLLSGRAGASTKSRDAKSRLLAFCARLSAFNRTTSGLDRSLMLINYGLKIVVGVGAAAVLRQKQRLVAMGGVEKALESSGLEKVTKRLDVFQASLGDARTMMRILGIFGAVAALPSALASGSRLRLAQILSLIAYYPLEAGSYLTAKGVLPVSATTAGRWSLWSVRFWALYVVLEAVALGNRWRGLVNQVKDVQEQDGQSVAKLDSALEDWTEEAVVNSAYAPLTVHWSVIGGLWLNPAWTGIFGVIAAGAGIRSGWRRMSA